MLAPGHYAEKAQFTKPDPTRMSTQRTVNYAAADGAGCWLVSNFHNFTVSFKSLTWPKVWVPGPLWLSDLLST